MKKREPINRVRIPDFDATKMKTENELIAEFMELEYSPDPFVESKKKYWHYGKILVMSDALQFDKSWEWLMPVVEKIAGLYHDGGLRPESKALMVIDLPIASPILDVYKAVVEFIRWYNTTQPPQTEAPAQQTAQPDEP